MSVSSKQSSYLRLPSGQSSMYSTSDLETMSVHSPDHHTFSKSQNPEIKYPFLKSRASNPLSQGANIPAT